MRRPACNNNSTIADMRISRRTASRKDLYSARVSMRGAEVSYLGWTRSKVGLVGIRPDWERSLKRVFRELILRLIDLAV